MRQLKTAAVGTSHRTLEGRMEPQGRSNGEWNRRNARMANGTAGTLEGYKALFLDDGKLPMEFHGKDADDDYRGGAAELRDDRR